MFNKLTGNDSERIAIQFEFDKGESIFEVGNTVSGTAVITANQDTVCHKIVIQMRWQTHGRGNRAAGKWMKETVQVAHNNLDANQTERIPFSFQLPEGPLTYRGEYLNVDWYVKAIVDARGPFDPSYEEEIIVLPKALETAYISNYSNSKLQQSKPVQITNSKRDLLIALAMLSSSIMVIAVVFIIGFPPFFAIFALVTLGISSLFFFKSIRNSISTQKLGPIKLELSQTELLPNETFNCHLNFKPLQDITLQGVTFKLQAEERVISGSGSNKTTHTKNIFEDVQIRLENKSILANESVNLEQPIQLPADAAYSFSANDNTLKWDCEVSIEIESWPNWKEKLPINVVPWRVQTTDKYAPSTSWSDEETARAS